MKKDLLITGIIGAATIVISGTILGVAKLTARKSKDEEKIFEESMKTLKEAFPEESEEKLKSILTRNTRILKELKTIKKEVAALMQGEKCGKHSFEIIRFLKRKGFDTEAIIVIMELL